MGMKKLLFVFAITLASCKKEDVPKQCWRCEITGSILGPQYDKVVEQCVEREDDLDMQWEDPFDNEMNVYCKRK